MLKEFKQFISRGNLVEIAVGLVMAVAFGAMVTSLVENVMTPIVGAVFGQPDFSGLKVHIWNDATIDYGSFLNALIAFLSVALAVFFFVVKPYNALRGRMARGEVAEAAPAATPEDVLLLREIRDSLKR